jgi:hypothetical protein
VTFPNLSVLCLSGNHCNGAILELNSKIHTLYANDVKWFGTTFIDFLRETSQFPLNLSVGFASKVNWENLFEEMKSWKRGFLISLDWEGNSISSSFIDFLNRNHELKTLSLSKCLKNGDEIGLVGCYLSLSQTHLKWLELRQWEIVPILQKLLRMYSLEFLDISYCQRGGDSVIEGIRPFLEVGTPIKQLVIDDLKVETPEQLLGLLEEAAVNKKVLVSFPHEDLMEFVKAGTVSRQKFEEIQAKFRVPAVETGFFGGPFQVYRYVREIGFPGVVMEEQKQRILRGRKGKPNVGTIRKSVF